MSGADKKNNETKEYNKRGGLPPRPTYDLESGKMISKEEEALVAAAADLKAANNTNHSGNSSTTAASFSASASTTGSDNNDNRSRASRDTKRSVGTASIAVTLDPSIIQLVSEVQQYGDETNADNNGRPRRKAGLCCGSCCDLVRGVVIVDIVYILSLIVSLIISLMDSENIFIKLDLNQSADKDNSNNNNDDLYYYGSSSSSLSSSSSGGIEIDRWGYVLLALCGLTMLFAGIGILGALRFRRSLVLSSAVWFCINGFVSAYDRRFVGMVFAFFYAYPHVHLFLALRAGNITPETYNTERHCCCNACIRDKEGDDDYE